MSKRRTWRRLDTTLVVVLFLMTINHVAWILKSGPDDAMMDERWIESEEVVLAN